MFFFHIFGGIFVWFGFQVGLITSSGLIAIVCSRRNQRMRRRSMPTMLRPAASLGVPAQRMATDDLVKDYSVRKDKPLGAGADGGVVRGVLRQTGEWHALKFVSSEAYDPQARAEIHILQRVQHPNVVKLLKVYEPTKVRKNLVLAMPEADFTLWDFMRRSTATPRLTECVLMDIASQMLKGVCVIHDHHVTHRDLKPQNVLLTVCPPGETLPSRIAGGPPRGGSCLRVQLADFSRACEYTVRDMETPLEKCTSNVCTPAYCAPERLIEGMATFPYGPEFDVWSFGAILFELLAQQPWAAAQGWVPDHDGAMAAAAARVFRRLGPPPEGAFRIPEDVVRRAATMDLMPLREQSFEWDNGSPAEALEAVLCWTWTDRASAIDTMVILRRPSASKGASKGERASTGALATPASLDGVAICQGHERKADVRRARATCACSGHCMNPGHRRHGCGSHDLLVGSSLCELCTCTVAGCACAKYDSFEYCHQHKRIAASLPWEVSATRATRSFAHRLLPCDLLAFLAWFPACKHDFASLFMLAWLKEPSAIQAWVGTGFTAAAQGQCSYSAALAVKFHQSLIDVATSVVHQERHRSELKQLCKQGVGRFMGSTRVIGAFHVTETTPLPSMTETQTGQAVPCGKRSRAEARPGKDCRPLPQRRGRSGRVLGTYRDREISA